MALEKYTTHNLGSKLDKEIEVLKEKNRVLTEALNSARTMLIMMNLLDKSGQCDDEVYRIDKALKNTK